ncbi:ABC transporter substrate-binding protein [Cryobacterium sp. SO2]|uniref:ABC transporter substrate-binding protein n=1 Tax=Cryobacterium sp. SO2 TaxID=1897060 RepID=UPI00223E2DFC|nr:ABC transporter substrate-binding protein [Cryobacterium sp. SO2]WEO75800.1 ABC transporter substrate-binding protein [Cryobacterium sp. SO2]
MKKKALAGFVASAAAVALLATGCSSAATTASSAGSTTLRMAFSSDMTTLDPTTIYQYEGNQVLTAVYEGLLEYKGDSTSEIQPLLAEAYTVSEDGLTYTFTLREGVTFADGTVMDSAAVQQSFERLADPDVASQMSYIVAGVASYATPDANTFVVTLSAPNSSFLSLIASPFGPKVINPTVLDAHSDDDALEYLQRATAGTGPYEVTEFSTGQQYTLTRNDSYWGDEPYYEAVTFKIIPDAATQVLQLQGGDLDIISGQPIATVQSFAANDEFEVSSLPTLQKAQLHFKTSGPLADLALREALRSSIDRTALVEQVWGDFAAESTQMYPVDNVADGLATDDWEVDTSTLAGLVSGASLTLGYLADQAQDKQVAEALQAQWQEAGVDITLVPIQGGGEIYGYSSDVASAPDMIYEASYPDSAHPDAWARLFWYSDTAAGNGVLNYLLGGVPAADALMDSGLTTLDAEASAADYAEVGDLLHDSVSYVTIADLQDTFIVRAGITGLDHWLPAPGTLQLKTLTVSK